MTVTDAAAYLKVDRKTIYRWCDAGRLRYYELESGGGRRFRREDLDKVLVLPGSGRGRSADWLADFSLKVARLENLVFPKGRQNGPLFTHQRTAKQWEEMEELADQIAVEIDPAYYPGAWSVLQLASGLLDEGRKTPR